MSTRSNRERVGTSQTGGEMPPAPIGAPPKISDPLNFVVPTEFVELPSEGKFYAEDHPLHETTEIEIKYMTAKEEDLLTSVALLKKGVALDRMLRNIIVDKTINIDDLLIGDKNAILVAARVSAYGADYSVKVSCPRCTAVTDHNFDLSMGNINSPGLDDNTFMTDHGTFKITLPRTEAVVEVKLLTGHDEKKLNNLRNHRNKNKLGDLVLTDQMKAYIVSVNDITAVGSINQFIENMPAFDSKYLRTSYQKIVPDVDMKQDFECIVCDHEERLEVPFNTEFFWPK